MWICSTWNKEDVLPIWRNLRLAPAHFHKLLFFLSSFVTKANSPVKRVSSSNGSIRALIFRHFFIVTMDASFLPLWLEMEENLCFLIGCELYNYHLVCFAFRSTVLLWQGYWFGEILWNQATRSEAKDQAPRMARALAK